MSLLEAINGKNAPWPRLIEALNPNHVRCIAWKKVAQVLNLRDIRDHARHASNPARHVRRKIVIEKELQIPNDCSKRTAASTMRGEMSKMRATALLSHRSARYDA